MRHINEIVVHCSATRPEWMAGETAWQKRQEIKRWHLGLGWSDIGYHYLVDRDGVIADGRPIERAGAHVQGRNANTIGVCLIGGHGSSETDQFADHFTAAQDRALRRLLADLRRRFPAIVKVSGHNEYAAKACPGFRVADWLAKTAPEVAPPPGKPEAPAEPGSISVLRTSLALASTQAANLAEQITRLQHTIERMKGATQ